MANQNPEEIFRVHDESDSPIVPAPWVVDVQLYTKGDMIYLAVAYSDGTVENQQASITVSTGAMYA